jgi:predicted AlkP superfamily phosphohydrolase/phosphomutase
MTKPRRVVVIGLDGATWDVLEPMMKRGELPTLQRLVATGCRGRLRSTMPPITAPAWSTLATGVNPGKHGVYDFIGREQGSYRTRPVDASSRGAKTMWSLLSQAGRRVCVVNVPMTYPVEPVNGILVSGLGAPGSEEACHPDGLMRELRQVVPDYAVQPEGIFDPVGREAEALLAARRMTDMRCRAALCLLDREPWDFFMVVFMAADVLQHYFWHYMDRGHPRHDPAAPRVLRDAIHDCYRQLDTCIDQILRHAGEQARTILMSDHGFGAQEKYFHVNTWLWRKGYLTVKKSVSTRVKELLFSAGVTPLGAYSILRALGQSRSVAQAIRKDKRGVRRRIGRAFLSFEDVDWVATRAYSLGNVGAVYVNLKGREPQGSVGYGLEYEELLSEISEKLAQERDPVTGEAIVGQILRNRDLYSGPRFDDAPDLIFVPRDKKHVAYGLMQLSTNEWIGHSDRSGGHRMDGLLIVKGDGIRANAEVVGAGLADVAPTVLAETGVPVPSYMDGRQLADVYLPARRPEVRMTETEASSPDGRPPAGLTQDEQHELEARLRGLGYVA